MMNNSRNDIMFDSLISIYNLGFVQNMHECHFKPNLNNNGMLTVKKFISTKLENIQKRYKNGDAGDRTRGLSHAKRTLYH